MGKYLVIFFSLVSCNNGTLPNEIDLKEEKSSYIGMISYKRFKIKSDSIDMSTLEKYPLNQNDYRLYKWVSLDENKVLFFDLKERLYDSFDSNTDTETMKKLLNRDRDLYISGYYREMIGYKNTRLNNYSYIYLLDLDNRYYYSFDFRYY